MHLYIHIPFCHRICPYCSFHKHTLGKSNVRDYIQALLKEARLKQEQYQIVPETIYFGGGTPSMLSDKHLATLFSGLKEIFDWNHVKEVSFESNPATYTEKRAHFFKELGITRISLGIQSWDPAILRTLGREHSPEEALNSIRYLQQADISQINVDLMFAIPGQSLDIWHDTLKKTADSGIHHISAYNLTYEEDTPFFKNLGIDAWQIDPDHDAPYFELTDEFLTSQGFRHYETSNYAREDQFLSQHNLGYWVGNDYLGLGPGAVSTIKSKRLSNIEDTDTYTQSLLQTGILPFTHEDITPEIFRMERIALLLRTDMGLPLNLLEITPHRQSILNSLVEEHMAILKGKKLLLQQKGRLLVDEIASELC